MLKKISVYQVHSVCKVEKTTVFGGGKNACPPWTRNSCTSRLMNSFEEISLAVFFFFFLSGPWQTLVQINTVTCTIQKSFGSRVSRIGTNFCMHCGNMSGYSRLRFTFTCSVWRLRAWGYKTFFVLNSFEHEIFPANKYLNANDCWHFNIY